MNVILLASIFNAELFVINGRIRICCYRFHVSETRTGFTPLNKSLQLVSISFSFYINTPVGHIFNKAGNSILSGFPYCAPSESHTLNTTPDMDLIQKLLVHGLSKVKD